MTIAAVRLNHAVLFVSDLERALDFYVRAFGTEVVAREPRANAAFLRMPGSENHHDLGLFGIGADAPPRRPGTVGLYHLAWQVDTIEALEQARLTLADLDAFTGESSHGATKSVYGVDPDGNEFEVMWMLPRASWGEMAESATTERLDLAARGTSMGRPSYGGPDRRGRVSTGFGEPVATYRGSTDPDAPLVVLLHGRGSDEQQIVTLADHLPQHLAYAAVRAPIAEGGGYAWFANRGIGRPVASSLADTLAWFRGWLDAGHAGRDVLLVGFSGGAAFAGGLLLADPARWAGAAILLGTLPFDAGVPTDAGRLAGVPVLVAQGDADTVIPRELLDRTWSYLHDTSGAALTAHRDPGGHGISAGTLAVLADWLTATA